MYIVYESNQVVVEGACVLTAAAETSRPSRLSPVLTSNLSINTPCESSCGGDCMYIYTHGVGGEAVEDPAEAQRLPAVAEVREPLLRNQRLLAVMRHQQRAPVTELRTRATLSEICSWSSCGTIGRCAHLGLLVDAGDLERGVCDHKQSVRDVYPGMEIKLCADCLRAHSGCRRGLGGRPRTYARGRAGARRRRAMTKIALAAASAVASERLPVSINFGKGAAPGQGPEPTEPGR